MAPSCGNFCCLQCLKDLYSKFSLYQIPDLDEAGQEMFACTKKCHGEICKVCNVMDDQKITWNHDRKEGDDDPNNLDNLLIKWLQLRATTPDSVTGQQAQEVQGSVITKTMRQSTTSSARMKYNNVPIKEIIVGLIQPECGGEDAPTLSQVSPGWDSRVPPRYGPVVLDNTLLTREGSRDTKRGHMGMAQENITEFTEQIPLKRLG